MGLSRDAVNLYSLVVVGSSAGGIEALSTLVATLPADFPAPLVLAQHLDPHHLSHLSEILARRSASPCVLSLTASLWSQESCTLS
ncbi:MAG: chemotaxis protein CheB, partial [Ktedonobacterales bacterium]